MRKFFLAFILVNATFASAEDVRAGYESCLNDQNAKRTAAFQDCVLLSGDAQKACNDSVEQKESISLAQQYCKMKSGVFQSRAVNTLAEGEQLAQNNKERERQINTGSPGAMSQLTGTIVNVRQGFVPPSRPSDEALRVDSGGRTRPPNPTPAERTNPNPNPQPAARTDARPDSPTRRNSDPTARNSNSSTNNETNSDGQRTGGNSIYDNVALAQSEAQMDVQSCQSKQNSASLCCNNPLSCASAADRDVMQRLNAGPGDDAGIGAYCQQMQGASNASSQINSRLAATCTNNQYACSNSCASLEQKYRGYMANCETCESYSVFMNAASQLASARNSCGQLQARGDQLAAQSLSSSSTNTYSQYCQQQAGMSPQSTSPQQAAGKAGAAARGADLCAANPTAPGCAQTAAALNAAPAGGQGSFSAPAAKTNKNSFALPDLAEGGFPGMKVDGSSAQAPTVRAVPNGGGGGFGGGAGAPATLGPGGGSRSNRAASTGGGPSVELGGFRSGGYSQPAGTSAAYELSGHDGDRKPNKGDGATFDLKQYLPGGRLAPVRRLAGTNLRSEINAKEEDLFRRISLKIYEKCRLGILWRCD